MGLDMYLTKKIYIGAPWEHRKVKAAVKISVGENKIAINPKKISYIEEEVVTWRKANQIHAWFVENVQKGVDDCATYQVSKELLEQLKELCLKAKEDKNPNLLPPFDGFFFGSTEIDDGYWQDIDQTIKNLVDLEDRFEVTYQYQSSW